MENNARLRMVCEPFQVYIHMKSKRTGPEAIKKSRASIGAQLKIECSIRVVLRLVWPATVFHTAAVCA